MPSAVGVMLCLLLNFDSIDLARVRLQLLFPAFAVQYTPDETALRSLAAAFFDAWAAKDLEACLRLWSKESPDLQSHERAMQKDFAEQGKISVDGLTILNVSVEGEVAGRRPNHPVEGWNQRNCPRVRIAQARDQLCQGRRCLAYMG